jgi:CubicO group peptidase (beta-lactamase class C family)
VSSSSRRAFLREACVKLGALGSASALSTALRAQETPRAKEPELPALPSFDRAMEEHMAPRAIPGGALAVLREGRLVHLRGYGKLDREREERVRSTSLFRLASLSKPITAIAVLRLVEAGQLELDQPILRYVDLQPFLEEGASEDPRWQRVTVRHCLQHSGGWDRGRSFDPMFRAVPFAHLLGREAPASAHDVIRVMRGRALDFDPGTRYAYSNFGYCLLGRAIESVAGTSYEEHVCTQVLAPLGARTMRIGRSLPAQRAVGETRYHLPPSHAEKRVDSAFPAVVERVPAPDGGFHLEAMDAHGGWIASALDLARFLAALDRPADPPLLRASSSRALRERPAAPLGRDASGAESETYYGLGWMVRPRKGEPERANLWHAGSLPGTSTLMVRRHDGLSWAVLFNQRQESDELPDGAIDAALHRAADAVEAWPREDLFERL